MSDIIVIGASAGGVEVLKQIVHDLPPDLPAAVFVVLHTGSFPSMLPNLLRRAGPLPADHPGDGEPIQNGRIYVAAPDHHLIVNAGTVHITRGPKENNARPSVNTLFRTAANAYGSRVTGVVLTGCLNDGTVGLWEIKRHGGTTIVQEPSEATFSSMPLSAIENVEIDHVVSANEIGALLGRIAKGELERPMDTQLSDDSDAKTFSGLTCPECRGPLWQHEHGKIKDFRCRVGHTYSFESMLEQHAVTTERALWSAALAVEEAAILAREAAERSTDEATRKIYEREAHAQDKHAQLLRTMLIQPDLLFALSTPSLSGQESDQA